MQIPDSPTELERLEKANRIKNGQSNYADRDTVGKIYRDAQIKQKTGETVECGDLTRELESSLVCDLNDTIQSKPYGDREFYITVHEKKDLAMPRAILRRMLTTKYRPFPEDDTIVFYVNPITSDIRFCWCLPHWSEMENMLANSNLYESAMINQIRDYRNENYWNFGFRKDEMGNWIPNEAVLDQPLKERVFESKAEKKFIYPIGWNIK